MLNALSMRLSLFSVITLLGWAAVAVPLGLSKPVAGEDRYHGLRHDVVYGGDVNVWKKTAAARFTVGLGFQKNMIGCSATLVAPDVLLTAAHCVTIDTPSGVLKRDPKIMTAYFVRTESADQAPEKMPLEKIKIAAIEVHPDWKRMHSNEFTSALVDQLIEEFPTSNEGFRLQEHIRRWEVVFDYDLALVKLAKRAPEGFLIVSLPDKDALGAGCSSIISGFGRDAATFENETFGIRSGMSARVEPRGFGGGERFTMSGNPSAGVAAMCKGDSGGPLLEICDGRVNVLGVASKFNSDEVDCAKPATEFMYAKTFKSLDWIKDTLDLVKSSPTGK